MIGKILRFIIVLGLCCVVMGGGVAVLYAIFKEDLLKRDNETKEEAILAVCPAGATVVIEKPLSGKPFGADAVYVAKTADGQPAAYIAGGAAPGYSGLVEVVISVSAKDRQIGRIVVVRQSETPGLGATVAETKSTWTLWDKLLGGGQAERLINPFLDQFPGRKPDQFKDIHAITAATITSNATKRAAAQAYDRIREVVDKPQ
jgi:RnfABCDGE-type electron transport complex G subunit